MTTAQAAETAGSRITDEALATLRADIGNERKLDQYNTVASEDAIRHYSLGIGDDNPRWLDGAYATSTRWGGMIAHPTFVMTCGFPRSRGLPGVHALFTGIDLRCHAPIKVGTRIHATAALHSLTERHGRYAGREFQQIYESKYRDEEGNLLSTLYSHTFRTERKAGGKTGKYKPIEQQHYTDEELAKIESALDKEPDLRRGAKTRYWEDVSVGDLVGPVIKGPLTVTDCICFLMGFGYLFVRAHRQWHEFRRSHPSAGIRNSRGIWDVPERVHWEDDLAREIGMPGAYDYGNQRCAWFDHGIHDWMGDDGWLRRLSARISAPNFIGDTTWVQGKVVEVNAADSSVAVDMECIDQRGRVTATAKAEVVLPRKNG